GGLLDICNPSEAATWGVVLSGLGASAAGVSTRGFLTTGLGVLGTAARGSTAGGGGVSAMAGGGTGVSAAGSTGPGPGSGVASGAGVTTYSGTAGGSVIADFWLSESSLPDMKKKRPAAKSTSSPMMMNFNGERLSSTSPLEPEGGKPGEE